MIRIAALWLRHNIKALGNDMTSFDICSSIKVARWIHTLCYFPPDFPYIFFG